MEYIIIEIVENLDPDIFYGIEFVKRVVRVEAESEREAVDKVAQQYIEKGKIRGYTYSGEKTYCSYGGMYSRFKWVVLTPEEVEKGYELEVA